jgi:hypothetical protein
MMRETPRDAAARLSLNFQIIVAIALTLRERAWLTNDEGGRRKIPREKASARA